MATDFTDEYSDYLEVLVSTTGPSPTAFTEVIDAYQPDQIWYDFGLDLIPDEYKRRMAAYYYGKEEEWGKEVEVMYKDHDHTLPLTQHD